MGKLTKTRYNVYKLICKENRREYVQLQTLRYFRLIFLLSLQSKTNYSKSIRDTSLRYDFLSMAVLPISNRTDSSLGSSPHACDPSKILQQTLDPVRRIDHRQNPCFVVQIGKVGFADWIFAPSLKAAVILPHFSQSACHCSQAFSTI